MEEKLEKELGHDGRFIKLEKFHITKFIYPRDPEKLVATCIVSGTDEATNKQYKVALSSALNNYKTPAKELATRTVERLAERSVSPEERLGPFFAGPFHTLWITKERDSDKHEILYVFQRMPDMFTNDAESNTHAMRPNLGATLSADQLFTRSRRGKRLNLFAAYAPELFRVMSQKNVVQLKTEQVRNTIDVLRNSQKADRVLSLHCWWKRIELPPDCIDMSLEQLHKLGEIYGYEDKFEDWYKKLALWDMFTRAFKANYTDGHTYATLSQLCNVLYEKMKRWIYIRPPGQMFYTDYFENVDRSYTDPLNRNALMNALNEYEEDAIDMGIIHRDERNIDTIGFIYYEYGTWNRREIALKFLNKLMAQPSLDRNLVRKCLESGEAIPFVPFPCDPSSRHFREIWHRMSDDQKTAIVNAVSSPISFIVGPPGTGKTEVLHALRALVGHDFLVGSAPYGIISRMLKKRMGIAYTCHRTQAIIAKRAPSDIEHQLLKKKGIAAMDEFELMTFDHLVRELTSCYKYKYRLVFLGDINQSGSINGCSFSDSAYERFSNREDMFVTLDIPFRFVDKSNAISLTKLLETKPTDPCDELVIPWNMTEIINAQSRHHKVPDLVYSTNIEDKQARMLLLPMGQDEEQGLCKLVEFIGTGYEGLASRNIQILTHTNKMRKTLSRHILKHIRSKYNPSRHGLNAPTMKKIIDGKQKAFFVGEKVTFLRNKYYVADEGNKETSYGDLDEAEAAREVSRQENQPTLNVDLENNKKRKRNTLTEQLAERPRARSDDVYNGDVRIIKSIEFYDPYKKEMQQVTNTMNARGNYCINFEDSTRLYIEDYEWENIEPGVVFTFAKYHGDQNERVVLFFDNHWHIDMKDLRTFMTRARRQFILLTGGNHVEAKRTLATVASKAPEKRRERFAFDIEIE